MTFRYQALEDALVDSVRRCSEGRRIAVACSGGLDSGLVSAIAMRCAGSVHLYTCGTSNAFDVSMGRDLGGILGVPWTRAPISKGSIGHQIGELVRATGVSDPFTISYEIPLWAVCSVAEEDTVLSGQGSDEYLYGCAKFIGQDRDALELLKQEGIDRLLKVSVPCERSIAAHFGKTMGYPYLDPAVVDAIEDLDDSDVVPSDMASRKAVLREVARHLGFPEIADRRKKASQYGSGTTDLIRGVAKSKGMRYNEYIASVYDSVASSPLPSSGRGSVIDARVESVLKAEAERIISECGSDPSEVIARLYRRIVEDGDLRSLERRSAPGRERETDQQRQCDHGEGGHQQEHGGAVLLELRRDLHVALDGPRRHAPRRERMPQIRLGDYGRQAVDHQHVAADLVGRPGLHGNRRVRYRSPVACDYRDGASVRGCGGRPRHEGCRRDHDDEHDGRRDRAIMVHADANGDWRYKPAPNTMLFDASSLPASS